MSIENEFYSGASTRTQLTLLAIEYGNLSIPENLVMTSAYAQTSPVRTDSGVRVKKLNSVGKGIRDMYVAFRFGAKLTILRATNQ